MARGDYTRRPDNWRHDPEMVQLHRAALTIPCRHCRQPAGAVCVKPDEPGRPELVNLPCHPVRATDARRGPSK
jgi:hypothetical protein